MPPTRTAKERHRSHDQGKHLASFPGQVIGDRPGWMPPSSRRARTRATSARSTSRVNRVALWRVSRAARNTSAFNSGSISKISFGLTNRGYPSVGVSAIRKLYDAVAPTSPARAEVAVRSAVGRTAGSTVSDSIEFSLPRRRPRPCLEHSRHRPPARGAPSRVCLFSSLSPPVGNVVDRPAIELPARATARVVLPDPPFCEINAMTCIPSSLAA